MSQGVTSKLLRLGNWKVTLAAVIVLAATQVLFAAYLVPAIQAQHPQAIRNGMLSMMDFQPLAAPEKQQEVLNLYAPEITRYVRLVYVVDFVLPLSMAFFFWGSFGWMLKYLGTPDFGKWLLWLPFGSLLSDYLENGLALFLIANHPEPGSPALLQFVGMVTALKFSCTLLLNLGLILLLALTLIKWLRTRGKTS